MRILSLLSAAPSGVRVTDLAKALDLNRAIPHRLLAELVELGYAVQDPETERYRATFALGSLGLRQLETAGIDRWAQDELAALAATTRELVRLAMVCGSELLWVAKAQGSNSALRIDPMSGSDVVLHATATGKAWLSRLPEEEIARRLTEHGLAMQTPYTETDLQRLIAEIKHARELGYALTHEEMEAGVNAIAVPIIPPELDDGRAVGTVSIAGPSARLTPEVLTSYVPALQSTTASLAAHWHVFDYLSAISMPAGSPDQGERVARA